MAANNTYTQLYIHFVFAVKYRAALLSETWDERLRLYISALVQNNNHKMIAINNMPDHMHLLVGLNPKHSIMDLMRMIKSDSSDWINKENLTKGQFNWQDGYGAFSHSRSEVTIQNQDSIKIVNERLAWRYATKKFDPAKKVSPEKLGSILEAVRLTPTSSGLQPFELLVVTNTGIREKIRHVAWNKGQVTDCSHLLVFAAWDDITPERVHMMFDQTNEIRGGSN